MRLIARSMLNGLLGAAALTLAGTAAQAQNPCPGCGSQVPVKDIHNSLADANQRMGLVRSTVSQVGQVNNYEIIASGTWVDLEAPTLGSPVPVKRITWNVMQQLWASRTEVETASGAKTIRVVKGKRAWDETWTQETTKAGPVKKLNTTPADAAVSLRAALVWVQPHAFISHAAFANAKKCMTPEIKACDTPNSVETANGRTVVSVTIEGSVYRGTLDERGRVGTIETVLKMPNGQSKALVANYTGWRAGEADTPDIKNISVEGDNVLDMFRNGTFWPEFIVWTLDGQKVLDLKVTEGWANPYTVYPDPELLAKGQ
jgi:hypothetical protein